MDFIEVVMTNGGNNAEVFWTDSHVSVGSGSNTRRHCGAVVYLTSHRGVSSNTARPLNEIHEW